MNLDISEINPDYASADYRPYIDVAMRFQSMINAPKDGRTIWAWSGNRKGFKNGESCWIPVYWDENRGYPEWVRCDGGSSWLSGDTDWSDTLIVWIELPTIKEAE